MNELLSGVLIVAILAVLMMLLTPFGWHCD